MPNLDDLLIKQPIIIFVPPEIWEIDGRKYKMYLEPKYRQGDIESIEKILVFIPLKE